jgi:hypothetical protein
MPQGKRRLGDPHIQSRLSRKEKPLEAGVK